MFDPDLAVNLGESLVIPAAMNALADISPELSPDAVLDRLRGFAEALGGASRVERALVQDLAIRHLAARGFPKPARLLAAALGPEGHGRRGATY